MSYAQNDAFAGAHRALPTGRSTIYFVVFYRSAPLLEDFNRGIPRGHADYRKVGWYWWLDGASEIYGPFSSSRKAYKDAMATLAKSEAA